MSKFDQYIIPNYARFPVSFIKGQGSRLWDDQGNEYLDLIAGIAVNSLGHNHPKLTKTIQTQAEKLLHCSNLYFNDQQVLLAEKLSDKLMRRTGKSFFCNSGAEANEAMLKLSRKFAVQKGVKNPEVVTFCNSFHGRTFAGISATGQDKVKKDFEPLLQGFRHCEFNNIDELENSVTEQTVGIMLEIVQGEGGINVATKEFLNCIQDLAAEHDLLIMVDEIQAGIGRSGYLNAWEAVLPDFQPHAVTWAKGLGGGFPIGAMWAAAEVADLLDAGSHGCTFGGNPLACSVANQVLDIICEESFLKNIQSLRSYIEENLQFEQLQKIKGLGLMVGLELKASEDPTPAISLMKDLFEKKILTVPAGNQVLRLLPALNISKEDLESFINLVKS